MNNQSRSSQVSQPTQIPKFDEIINLKNDQEEIVKQLFGLNSQFSAYFNISSSKIRQYYDQVVSLYYLTQRKKTDINNLKIQFLMLLMKIKYDVNKESPQNKERLQILQNYLDAWYKATIINGIPFKYFKLHFERLVAEIKEKKH